LAGQNGKPVAVVTPAYNVARFIGDTIASVVAQSYQDWAMTVVDDGSTDETADVVAGCADRRVHLIRQANAGVSAARNHGLANTTGERVLFLDGDDCLAPDALARLTATLDAAPGCVAAYGAFCFVTESGTPVHYKRGPFPSGDILERLLEENLFANGGHILIRRSALDRVGPFRTDLAYGEDWVCWTRLALAGPFAVVPGTEPLLLVRQRGSGIYLRVANDPAAFEPCMNAIFGNPALAERFGPERVRAIRRRAEAENEWIVGRELIRHGRGEGRRFLRRSVASKPSVKRVALLLAAHALPLLPSSLRGPFRGYSVR
jgi:glycosyltransferase involved in cell wall biosynthesis